MAVSLDGFIARTDGGLDWLARVHPQDSHEDYGYSEFMDSIDTVILGRHTYDSIVHFDPWPMRGKRVIVLTSRPLAVRHGETCQRGKLRPLLAQLAQQGVRHVYVDGGQVARQALIEGVVDDMTLSWIPVLLGRGRPLFGVDVPETDWELQALQRFPTGLAQGYWVRAHQ